MATRVDSETWWEFDDIEVVICGDCLNNDLAKTERGEYTGDEAVTMDLVHQLFDADEEAYQCEVCSIQSLGYDLDPDE